MVLAKCESLWKTLGMGLHAGTLLISHVAFADDILLMVDKQSLEDLISMVILFCKELALVGLEISWDKCRWTSN
eukprot:2114971-Heterocapsa_arctica.AAC.1